ncbi:MAG: dihydroorotate dehydrogenase [Rhodospirillaceae bacterium TMED63]|nr:dihydroorotate dehydrogenase [Rhodospirillaceae bacterium]RPG04074.1 MAG: dihydroorotate dehydrogenase [Rhodospirillaceae bacterium TMED63]
MASTEITIGSVSLKNPVICGSGEHVMTEAGLQSALDAGVGAVVAKSINETQAAKDQLDRTDYALLDGDWNRLPWDFTAPRNATLACRSGLQKMDFDSWLEIITRLDATAANSGQYVIGSIILADLDAAVDMAQQMAAAGVRILEFNIGTPYGDEAAGVVTTERATAPVTEIVKAVCDAVYIPVWAKITGQSENVAALVQAARAGGAETVVLMGRFLGMIPELDTQAPLLGTNLGTGGGWALPMTCYWLAKSRAALGADVPLIGINGARTGNDVLRMILAGAHAVEISSAVFTNGFSVLADAVKTVESYLANRDQNTMETVGRAADRVGSLSGLPQRPGFWEQFVPPEAL